MLSAHAQDYERRRKPEVGKDGADDSDEDEEESSEEDNATPKKRRSSGRVEEEDEENRRDVGEAEDAVTLARGGNAS